MPNPPGAGKDIVGQIINCLRQNNGMAILNTRNLSREFDCAQGYVAQNIRRLIDAEIIVCLDNFKQGFSNLRFKLVDPYMKEGDGWRDALSRSSKQKKESGDTIPIKIKTHSERNDDLALKLATSRELVAVYEKLNQAQQLALQLQEENKALQAKVAELDGELETERSSHRRDANDIATLELQLRELRSQNRSNEKRLLFDIRGAQA